MRTLALVLLGLLCATPAQAQLWSGIVDPLRAADWSNPGATIVHRTTQCGATIASGSSASTINTAITNCTAGQFVHLGTGTFNLTTGLVLKSNVTLRGDGPNNTRLIFTGTNGCNGLGGAVICVSGGGWSLVDQPNIATLSGTFSQGQTTLTFSNTTGLAVGRVVVLDQNGDGSTDTFPQAWVCTTTVCATEGGCSHCRGSRATQQVVAVTAINGSAVTFAPGLYASYWTSSKSPGAVWDASNAITGVGIEELAINVSSVASNGISFFSATNSWARAVESYQTDRAQILLFQSTGITVRDSYFDEGQGHQSQSYGLENYVSSDCLIENNIWHHVTAPISVNGSASGCVYAYNYSLNNTFFPNAQSGFTWLHEGGIDTLLYEGNDMPAWFSDIIHGTHNFVTVFRNFSRGWESGLTNQTIPVYILLGGRFYNVIGNVLGTNAYHTTYQSTSGSTSIYALGASDTALPNDTHVAETLMRWGNYDTVNDATRFLSSEVPSGLSVYSNAVPGSTTLPSSFYLTAKPAFFGSVQWPPIGPDVTGGFDASLGNHVHKIPARLCYENSAKDGTGKLTSFNPTVCYAAGGADSTPPVAPQNLRIQ